MLNAGTEWQTTNWWAKGSFQKLLAIGSCWEAKEGIDVGICSNEPRVNSWPLTGTETPSAIVAEVTRRVGPYFWESYDSGNPHQLKRFVRRAYLSEYAMEIASLEWELCYLAVASFTAESDSRFDSRVSVVWDRTHWNYGDWLEYEDLELFVDRIRSFFTGINSPKEDAFFFENSSGQLQQALEGLIKAVHLPREFLLPSIQADQRRPLMDQFLALRVSNSSGELIDKSRDESRWLKARKLGITATDVNRLIKLSGERRTSWWDVLDSKSPDHVPFEYESFALGVEREPVIAQWAIETFSGEGFVANNWLFADSEEPRFMATPDLIGDYAIAEVKVSTKPLDQILSRYRDQLQWQLKVLNCERLLFIVEQRTTQTTEAKWINADAERQEQLGSAAYELLAELEESLPTLFGRPFVV